jgi:2',3'-cyclic-nucleotide 2'-phosphodiesterase (5'-nucleotidase family)
LLAGELHRPSLEAPAEVQRIFEELQATPLIQNLFEEIGTTTSPLVGLRAEVRTRETNLGRLAADSTVWATRTEFPAIPVDVALKNGGGIRDTIQGPSIIRLTIQAALAFDNKLAVLQMSGDQLLAAMENSVSRFPAADGRFPQVAGMFLEYDSSKPGLQGLASVAVPSRVKTLRITRFDGSIDVLVDDFVAQGDLTRTFVMATNDFLSTGGDGYAALAAATKLATTAIGEQKILEDYIRTALGGTVDLVEPLAAPRIVRVNP